MSKEYAMQQTVEPDGMLAYESTMIAWFSGALIRGFDEAADYD